MISTSDAILLGSSMYPANDGSQWVNNDGKSGCALGRAFLAVGGYLDAKGKPRFHMNHTVCANDIAAIWPWLGEGDIMYEISDMFTEVMNGHLTMDELVDFVASREPAALEATIESPWQKMVRGA